MDSAAEQSKSVKINSDTKPMTSGNDLVEEPSLKDSHAEHGKESKLKKKQKATFKTKPRGSPKQIRTTLDVNIAHLLSSYKPFIRDGVALRRSLVTDV